MKNISCFRCLFFRFPFLLFKKSKIEWKKAKAKFNFVRQVKCMIEVKCFGIAQEITGHRVLHLEELEELSVQELKDYLLSKYSEFGKIKDFMVAVNQAYGAAESIIRSGDEVAIIPPVSGG